MTIVDHPSPNHSPRKEGVRVDTVLLHHTATEDIARPGLAPVTAERAALLWLSSAKSGVSAHYVVGRGGEVWRLVPEHLKAWHAGKGRLPWETCKPYDFNHRSIGIEVVNPGDGKTPFTEAQYRALESLVPDVVRRLGGKAFDAHGMDSEELAGLPDLTEVKRVWVLGHRDVAPGRKTDPADNFDWGRIRKALARGVA